MSAADLLDRLQKVKKTGENRWIACCPAHADRSPSLSIRELDDGRTLLHCFGGCESFSVLTSVGLDWSAMFAPNQQDAPPSHSRTTARDMVLMLNEAAFQVWHVATRLQMGQPLTPQMSDLLDKACRKITNCRDEMGR